MGFEERCKVMEQCLPESLYRRQVEKLHCEMLAHVTDIESQLSKSVMAERERCIRIIEAHQVQVGNSAAGEMAAEWTMDALREVRNAIKYGGRD